MATYEVLREAFAITERHDGAVYATQSLGLRWVDGDEAVGHDSSTTDVILTAPSSAHDGPTIRTKRGS